MTSVSRRAAPPLPLLAALAALVALVLAVGAVGGAVLLAPSPAQAASLSVATARATQDGSTATVRGYVVGQPTAATTVVRSGFPSDYALALADRPGVTDPAQMVYVQVPSAFRPSWGLRSNPGLLDRLVEVTGTLAAYFSRPGVTGASAFSAAGGGAPTPPSEPTGPAGYWGTAAGLTGDDLAAEVHDIISTGVRRLSYDAVWDALRVTDRDPARPGNVVLLYQGTSVPATANGGGPDQWNREHVWAKSHGDFGTSAGPGTDIHHLRPTDVTVNAARGNLDFDDGGSPNAEAPGNYADRDSWEPRDADKGDVARMILYMDVRWDGGDGFPDLEVDDATSGGSAPRHGRLSTLLEWHALDPVSAAERRRNDAAQEIQGNRNPFIDHPEWVASIW